jgi:hypothetical protein
MGKTRIGIGMLAVGALGLSACGGSTHTYANQAPPPTTVNLTVYINNSRVSVSPSSTGIGPVTFIVANHATNAESLTIEQAGAGSQPLANTGPINPQGTAQVNVEFKQQGDYTVAAGHGDGTEASTAALSSSIAPATIHIGAQRQSSRGDLETP